MSNYDYTVKLSGFNVVDVSIIRDGEITYEIAFAPRDIGIIKFLFSLLFFGTARVQSLILKKAHKRANQYIENMKELER